MLELLSPAASTEAVIAAVQSGADAIYIKFGGSGAEGFTENDFRKSIRYCRVRGCKVYAQLGTLVSDEDLAAACALARRGAELGVTAMIVQDMGLVSVLRAILPDMRVFAGEGMGLHNLAGIEAAAQLGVSRVFLPREMTGTDIEQLASHTKMELAVTVFGEMCFARTGICYMSAMTTRESANCGACSRLCRGEFSMGGRMDDRPMNIKDTQLIGHLAELDSAGVACAAIGGDVERPERVALVTGVCRRCMDAGQRPSPGELEDIALAFSERDFTDGYYTGELGPDMLGERREPDRAAAKLLADVRRRYQDSEIRRVPVKIYAVMRRDSPLKVAAEDADGNRAVYTGPSPQPARLKAVSDIAMREELSRTGGTPYIAESVDCIADEGLELPEDALSEAKRIIVKILTEKRAESPRKTGAMMPETPETRLTSGHTQIIFEVQTAEQLTRELAELKPDYLYVPLEVAANSADNLFDFMNLNCTPVVIMPRVIPDSELNMAAAMLKKARANGVTQALVGNLGHIAVARMAGMDARGDFGLNLYNSHAMEAASRAGLLSATASIELRLDQIRAMAKPLDTELIVYGRVPVMVTEQCMIKPSAGRCVCQTHVSLTDKMGGVYPVMKEFGCRNTVFAPTKLFLADRREDYEKCGLWGVRVMFTTESPRECVAVAKSCLGMSDYRPNGLTRGLYYRGVK